MFKADRCFEVGQSYLAFDGGFSCATNEIITVTKRTKRILYFLYTSKKHGCDGVIHKAKIERLRNAGGAGETVYFGHTASLFSGRYFCACYDLIGRMQEEEEFVLSEEFLSYCKDKPVSREDLLARAAHSWAWCFAE